jgi:hypothetical protein
MGHAARPSTLRVPVRPSRIYSGLLTIVHLLAAIAMFASNLPLWMQLAGVVALGGSLWHESRHTWRTRDGNRILALEADAHGGWRIESTRGLHPARLLASSRFWTRVLFLHFDVDGRKLHLPLVFDSVPGGSFRRLRVRLLTRPFTTESRQVSRGA